MWKFICERLKAQNLDFATGLIEKRLEKGRAVVLLDGLDEISTPMIAIFSRISGECQKIIKQPLPEGRKIELSLPKGGPQ